MKKRKKATKKSIETLLWKTNTGKELIISPISKHEFFRSMDLSRKSRIAELKRRHQI